MYSNVGMLVEIANIISIQEICSSVTCDILNYFKHSL